MILVTGGTGMVGKSLVERLPGRILSISRRVPPAEERRKGVKYQSGDILMPNLGLPEEECHDIDVVYHLAGTVNLSPHDSKGAIRQINVEGTANVIDFCIAHNVRHLFYTSTAYTEGRNPYERSKAEAEAMVRSARKIPKITIFKPSIVVDSKIPEGALSTFISLMVKFHQHAESARIKVEDTLHLPPWRFSVKVHGEPDAPINLVAVEDVARGMAEIQMPGTYHLVNRTPPTTQQVFNWIGEELLLHITVQPEFHAGPLDFLFERMTNAFSPYLWGDNFTQHGWNCPTPVDREFVQKLVRSVLGK